MDGTPSANFYRAMMDRQPVRPTSRRQSNPPIEPAPALARALEQDKEVGARSPTQPELDGGHNVYSADLEMIENVAESMISPIRDQRGFERDHRSVPRSVTWRHAGTE
jgi:hypothetical protein